MDLTKADVKRWQEHTEELYKKDHHDLDNHEGVITHLQPDLLECEDKWASRSITMNKASRGNRTPAQLFQILKDAAVKGLHSPNSGKVARLSPVNCQLLLSLTSIERKFLNFLL